MIIVNFSSPEFKKPQTRLRDSIRGHACVMYGSYSEIGSPTHQESPYEFKVHAIRKASQIDPVVLWCDSSLYRVGDISLIENLILSDGYFMSEAGHYAGRWTNHHTRRYFEVTEKEMTQGEGGITMFSAGLLGLDLTTPIAIEFLREWEDAAEAGCFRGDWSDHRHDMTCASIIASRLGMKYQRGGKHMAYLGPGYSQPEQNVVFYLQGL